MKQIMIRLILPLAMAILPAGVANPQQTNHPTSSNGFIK